MKDEEEVVKTPLTLREKMVIIVLLFTIKVIKPSNWSHELDEMHKELKDLMKNGA